MRVQAETEPLEFSFTCPECKEQTDTCLDLEDYTNISYGITVDETCSACRAEFKVEVL